MTSLRYWFFVAVVVASLRRGFWGVFTSVPSVPKALSVSVCAMCGVYTRTPPPGPSFNFLTGPAENVASEIGLWNAFALPFSSPPPKH